MVLVAKKAPSGETAWGLLKAPSGETAWGRLPSESVDRSLDHALDTPWHLTPVLFDLMIADAGFDGPGHLGLIPVVVFIVVHSSYCRHDGTKGETASTNNQPGKVP